MTLIDKAEALALAAFEAETGGKLRKPPRIALNSEARDDKDGRDG